MTDESLMLDIDIIEKKHEEELNALRKELGKELKDIIADKDEVLTEKDREISVKDEEIKRLKEILAKAGLQS